MKNEEQKLKDKDQKIKEQQQLLMEKIREEERKFENLK